MTAISPAAERRKNADEMRSDFRMKRSRGIAGELVEIEWRPRRRPLDGFLVHGDPAKPAVVIIHGMHSNFYRSPWKKALLRECAAHSLGALSFNNRGAEARTNDERFRDCLADIAAAISFMKSRGYRSVILVGHSTGCQKATYYQAVRRDPRVAGIVLLAIGDDLAIMRRDLGRAFDRWVKRAKRMVKRGRGQEPLGAPGIPPFSARRFLSIADPASVEARLFDLSNSGPRGWFERIRCPVLCILAGCDEYETLPPDQATRQLAARYRGSAFAARVVRRADHSFRGSEKTMAGIVIRWATGEQGAKRRHL